VALNPSTPASTLEYVLDELDLVLVMSVKPGLRRPVLHSVIAPEDPEVKTLLGSRPVDVSSTAA